MERRRHRRAGFHSRGRIPWFSGRTHVAAPTEATFENYGLIPIDAWDSAHYVRRNPGPGHRPVYIPYVAPTHHAGVPEDFVRRLRRGDNAAWQFHNNERRRVLHNLIRPRLRGRTGNPNDWVQTYSDRTGMPYPVAADDIIRLIQGEPVRERYFPQDGLSYRVPAGSETTIGDTEFINGLDQWRYGMEHHSFRWPDRHLWVESTRNRTANVDPLHREEQAGTLDVDADIDPADQYEYGE